MSEKEKKLKYFLTNGKRGRGRAAARRENMWVSPPAEPQHGFLSCNRLLGSFKV
jgi:hypothetical protein